MENTDAGGLTVAQFNNIRNSSIKAMFILIMLSMFTVIMQWVIKIIGDRHCVKTVDTDNINKNKNKDVVDVEFEEIDNKKSQEPKE